MDEDIHLSVALALRKRGYNAVHVQELDRKGKSDAEQLRYAVKKEMCLFSFNVRDFVLLHNKYVEEGEKHLGIIVSKQLTVGETTRKILKVLQLFSHESLKNRIEFL